MSNLLQPFHNQSALANVWPIDWRVSLRRTGIWLPLVSAVVIGSGFVLSWLGKTAVTWHPLRIIEAILPLSFALQATFALPPDGEPTLELLSSYKRPLPLIGLERLLMAFLAQASVGLIATFLGVSLFDIGAIGPGLLRWLPPTLFFGGTIFFTVQLTRQGTQGALIAILLWGGLFFGGNAALLRWPFLQWVHAFLQPEAVSPANYAQNRVSLTLFGLFFTTFGLWLLRDQERVLGWRSKQPISYWAKRAPVYLLGTAVLVYLVSVGLWIDEQIQRSEAPVCCLTPSDLDMAYESVQLTAADGITLAGWYVPSSNGAAVILLHGYGGHRAMMLPQAQALAKAGFGVLLYDLRGHSESGGDQRTFGWADVADVEAAIDYLQARADVEPERIGIFGFSMGGQIALRATAQLNNLQAVMVDGPGFANADDLPPPQNGREQIVQWGSQITFQGLAWRMGLEQETAVIDQIDQISPRPLLLIATGPADGVEQQIVQHFYNHAAEPKAIWTIPEATHGTGFSIEPSAYAQKLVRFFEEALLEK